MFVVTQDNVDAIRIASDQAGELPAAIEMQRRFPGITDHAKTRMYARMIVNWSPLPYLSDTITPLQPGNRR